MTKKQKIWLSIFLAMFLIPEILWGGIVSFVYNSFFNKISINIMQLLNIAPINNNLIAAFALLCQLIGLVGLFFFMISNHAIKNKFLKILIIVILVFFIALSGFYMFMGLYYLGHTPQIG